MSLYSRVKPTGLIKRTNAALDVFRHGYPTLARPEQKARIGAMGWPNMGEAQPQWHLIDYATYVEQGVNLNSVVYSAIRYKWQSTSSAPLRAYSGDIDHPELLDPAHPLSQLVARPNPHQDWRELQGQADAFLNVSGNAYFWLQRPKSGEGLPEAIYCPRPDRIFIIPGKSDKQSRPTLSGYIYVPEGRSLADSIPILPKNLMHVKLFNPLDSLNGLGYGLSPLSSAAYSIDVDNSVTKFLQLFFERGGVPPYWFTFDQPVDDTTIDSLKAQIQEMYGGKDNWVKPGVLGQGGDVKRVGLTFQEMGFDGIDERNESRILGPLGVPPILIGTRTGLERSTYSNYEQARSAFWEDVMLPELLLFESEYQYYLRSEDGAFVAFDFSGVPALQKDLPKLIDAAFKMWQMGTPANTAYETVGLRVSGIPTGDTAYLPLGLIPVGSTIDDDDTRTEEGAPEAEEDDRKLWMIDTKGKRRGLSMESKQRLGKGVNDVADAWVPRYQTEARRQLEEDHARLLELSRQKKAQPDWLSIGHRWQEYLGDEGLKRWTKGYTPLLAGLTTDVDKTWESFFDQVKMARKAFPETIFMDQAFVDYLITFAQPIMETTNLDTVALLKTATAEGWAIPDMAEGLDVLFRAYIEGGGLTADQLKWFVDRIPGYRLENISRTETTRAANWSSIQTYKNFNVEFKEWLATLDGRQRPSHEDAMNRYMSGGNPGPIPIGAPFIISGGIPMQYPGDGPPSESCQCRCTSLPFSFAWGV